MRSLARTVVDENAQLRTNLLDVLDIPPGLVVLEPEPSHLGKSGAHGSHLSKELFRLDGIFRATELAFYLSRQIRL